MSANDETTHPRLRRSKSRGKRIPVSSGSGPSPPSDVEQPPLVGEFIGRDDEPGNPAPTIAQALVPIAANHDPADEKVVDRVEHLNRGAGWALITAGIVGMVVPGVLGTPFLIMGALVLWPGSRKKVEHWRQGHSPKLFHGAMKQINRFLDDLEKRYPRINR